MIHQIKVVIKLITVKSFSRQTILKIQDDNRITDFYGVTKYYISGQNLLNYYRQVVYKFDSELVKDFYGKTLYRLNGNDFKDFYGVTLLKFDGSYIKDFYGRILYIIDGTLNSQIKMILGTLYMEFGSLEKSVK